LAEKRVFVDGCHEKVLCIGFLPDTLEPKQENINGWGIRIYSDGALEISNPVQGKWHWKWFSDQRSYIGHYDDKELFHGHGVFTYGHGVKYDGEYKHDFMHGYGTLIYWDNFQAGGLWVDDVPLFDPSHPDIKDCVIEKRCTNSLSRVYPQYWSVDHRATGGEKYYCESCWINCCGKKRKRLRWHMYQFKSENCQCCKCLSL
jgi:hypothetical protein